jgi:uncharacterized protein (DUF433 family)
MFELIHQTPGKLGGKANIEGQRISVSLVLQTVSARQGAIDLVKADFPSLSDEGIRQALAFAAYHMLEVQPEIPDTCPRCGSEIVEDGCDNDLCGYPTTQGG